MWIRILVNKNYGIMNTLRETYCSRPNRDAVGLEVLDPCRQKRQFCFLKALFSLRNLKLLLGSVWIYVFSLVIFSSNAGSYRQDRYCRNHDTIESFWNFSVWECIDQDKLEEKQLKFKINQFNLMVSDMLPLNRSLKVRRTDFVTGMSTPSPDIGLSL